MSAFVASLVLVGCTADQLPEMSPPTMAGIHTGVLRNYRRRNIALALKLLGIHWSKKSGGTYARTNNDSQLTPILAINKQLGYRPIPGDYWMSKFLNE